MTDVKNLGPLDWRIAISDRAGRPTPEFQRRWDAQRVNNNLFVTITFGVGAPTDSPDRDGSEYIDTSTTPYTLYVVRTGAWHKVGPYAFTDLTDTPHTYSGSALKLVRVNAGATALEFSTIAAALDSIGSVQGDILYRNATGWTVLPPGTASQLLQTGGASANPSWVNAPTSLPSIANNTLLANTSGSSAVPVATTVSALLDSAIGSARGDIIYRGASGWVVLAPGTAGYALVTNGASADPSWSSITSTPGGTSGQVQYNNSGAFGGFTASGDATINTSTGAINVTKTGGVIFATSATTDTTNAANISSGSLGAARMSTNLSSAIDTACGSTRGSIIYRGASGWVTLAPGTLNYVLLSQGSGADPIWGLPVAGANPLIVGDITIEQQVGVPSRTDRTVGSIAVDNTGSNVYINTEPAAGAPVIVQAKNSIVSGTTNWNTATLTLSSAPTTNNVHYLIAVVTTGSSFAIGTAPTANTGWTLITSGQVGGGSHFYGWAYRMVQSGDSATVTPFTGATGTSSPLALTVWEVKNLSPTWANSYQNVSANNSTSITGWTTTAANTLALESYSGWAGGGSTTGTLSAGWNASATSIAGPGVYSSTPGDRAFATNGTAVSGSVSYGFLQNAIATVLFVNSPTATNRWQLLPHIPIGTSNITGSTGAVDNSLIRADGTAGSTIQAGSGVTLSDTGQFTFPSGIRQTFAPSATTPGLNVGAVAGNPSSLTDGDLWYNSTGTVLNARINGSTVALGGGGGGTTTNNYYGQLIKLTRLQRTSNQSISNATNTAISWDTTAVQDEVSAFSAGTPTKVTVPSGYSSMRVTWFTNWTANSTGQRNVTLSKNGINNNVIGVAVKANSETGDQRITPWLTVTPGDTYEIDCYQDSGGSLNFDGGSSIFNHAWVQFEWKPSTDVVSPQPQPGLPVISETITSGSQSSVTISSIPSTYRDIEIVVKGRGTTAAAQTYFQVQVNGLSTSIYSLQRLFVNNASVAADQGLLTSGWGSDNRMNGLPGSTVAAGQVGLNRIRIYDYANSSTYKVMTFDGRQVLNTSGDTSHYITGNAQVDTTSTITSVTISMLSGGFVDGSVITVYGIGGSSAATLPVISPQGRLTLTSGAPVMTADATAQGTIYYAPYVGTLLPVGNVMYRFSQLSYVLNTTAHTSTNLYDMFAYNSSGTITPATGPAWTNSTTRSNAISQDATNGIWVNTSSITLNLSGGTTTTTVAAGQATYLGTFYATANGQTGMAFQPTAAAGGTNNILGLWNAYNRINITALNRDNTGSWSYNSTTWRAMNANNSNRITFVDGLQQSHIEGVRQVSINSASASSVDVYIAMDLDSTSATPQTTAQTTNTNTTVLSSTIADRWSPQLGLHYIQAVEATSANANFYGAQSSPTRQLNSMIVSLQM